jgi:magnesium chelatase accessory protein
MSGWRAAAGLPYWAPHLPSECADWRRDGRDWPNREASRFHTAAGLRWHVQVMGQGPVMLLVHGTGASTHSFRDLMPRLAERFTVVAADLPGHGFSATPPLHRQSLPMLAQALQGLLELMGVIPEVAVGHSAGAAIVARMALDAERPPHTLVSLNGAFLPFREGQHHFFSGLARLMVINPLVPRIFALTAANPVAVERLIRNTGSVPDATGIELYRRLLRRPGHVAAALGMMAGFDLVPLLRDLPRLKSRLVLVVGDGDRAVPPAQATRVRAHVPSASLEILAGLGHLAHEERPDLVADLVLRLATADGPRD